MRVTANRPTLRSMTGLVMSIALISFTRISFAADDPASQPFPASQASPASQGILPIPDYSGDLLHRSYLTGDWGGARTQLAEKGIQLDVDWTQFDQSVVSGGTDTGNRYGGNLNYLVHFDLMRMGVLPGALITLRAETRYGQAVNDLSGSILPVNTAGLFPLTQQLDDNVPITITDLNYTQFLSENLAITLGKLDTLSADLNEFASGRGTTQFMNANFIFNSALALRLPYSTLGVGVLWLPIKNLSFNAALVNTVDASTTSGFKDFGEGTSATAELDWQYRIKDFPGGMNVGGLYSFDQDFAKLTGSLISLPGGGQAIPNKSDTWALYWSGWQYVLIKDPDDKPIDVGDGVPDHEGLGVFARLGLADEDTNPIKFSGSIGIGGRGLIPTRRDDVYGLGYYYTKLQDNRFAAQIGVRDQAQGVEAFYNIAITPAAHLTLDLQVQHSPLPGVDTTAILGMRFRVVF